MRVFLYLWLLCSATLCCFRLIVKFSEISLLFHEFRWVELGSSSLLAFTPNGFSEVLSFPLDNESLKHGYFAFLFVPGLLQTCILHHSSNTIFLGFYTQEVDRKKSGLKSRGSLFFNSYLCFFFFLATSSMLSALLTVFSKLLLADL